MKTEDAIDLLETHAIFSRGFKLDTEVEAFEKAYADMRSMDKFATWAHAWLDYKIRHPEVDVHFFPNTIIRALHGDMEFPPED